MGFDVVEFERWSTELDIDTASALSSDAEVYVGSSYSMSGHASLARYSKGRFEWFIGYDPDADAPLVCKGALPAAYAEVRAECDTGDPEDQWEAELPEALSERLIGYRADCGSPPFVALEYADSEDIDRELSEPPDSVPPPQVDAGSGADSGTGKEFLFILSVSIAVYLIALLIQNV